MGLSAPGRLIREEGAVKLVEITGAPSARREFPVFVQLLITLALGSRLAAESLGAWRRRLANTVHKATAAIGRQAYGLFDRITSPIWDGLDTMRGHVRENGLARSLAAFLWTVAGKAFGLSLVVTVAIIWSLVWSTFGFAGTWQLLVKIGFIAAIFLVYFSVEYT